MFDFNASLNDFAPVSLMLFPVDLMKNKKERIAGRCHLRVVSFVFTAQIELSECFVRFQCITQ